MSEQVAKAVYNFVFYSSSKTGSGKVMVTTDGFEGLTCDRAILDLYKDIGFHQDNVDAKLYCTHMIEGRGKLRRFYDAVTGGGKEHGAIKYIREKSSYYFGNSRIQLR